MFESDSSPFLERYDDDDEKLLIGGLATCNGLFDHEISEAGVSTLQELGDWLRGGGVTASVKLAVVDTENVNLKPVLSVSKLFAHWMSSAHLHDIDILTVA
jgi:hypothetical protein